MEIWNKWRSGIRKLYSSEEIKKKEVPFSLSLNMKQ